VPALEPWFRELPRSVRENALFLFTSYFHVELLVYTGIVAFANASASRAALQERERDALRLTSALATARLQALRAQLQPHFLFNALHTIGSLVLQRQNDRAVGMIAELGDLLRATLSGGEADLIPLSDELTHLRRYIRIEEARFGDRLKVQWDVAGAPAQALDPAWSLAGSRGIGLRNIVERLQVREPSSQLTVENTGTSGVTASLSLPLAATDEGHGRTDKGDEAASGCCRGRRGAGARGAAGVVVAAQRRRARGRVPQR